MCDKNSLSRTVLPGNLLKRHSRSQKTLEFGDCCYIISFYSANGSFRKELYVKCQICKDENATIHLTEIEDGVKKEVHLCETCYKEKNLPGAKPPSINNLIKTFIEELEKPVEPEDETVCPVCGITFSEFQKTGLFGCPEDYTVFRDEILGLVEKIHGAVKHSGKIPKVILKDRTDADRLIMLRKELDEAVRNEMYERAAELRDDIRKLENREGSLS